jgi:hyperosmotically inducible protein
MPHRFGLTGELTSYPDQQATQNTEEVERMRVRNAWSLAILVAGLSLVMSCASTDMGITASVKAKLVADETVKSSQIEVKTTDGIVTLTGNVDSDDAKSRAIELAKGTKGVVSVVDMIAARRASGTGDAPDPDRSLGETITDTGITMSVKSQFLDDPLVKGLKIDVDTRDGVVFLTGSVGTDAEKQKAIQLAKDTKGVRDVQANLTLEKS